MEVLELPLKVQLMLKMEKQLEHIITYEHYYQMELLKKKEY